MALAPTEGLSVDGPHGLDPKLVLVRMKPLSAVSAPSRPYVTRIVGVEPEPKQSPPVRVGVAEGSAAVQDREVVPEDLLTGLQHELRGDLRVFGIVHKDLYRLPICCGQYLPPIFSGTLLEQAAVEYIPVVARPRDDRNRGG